jgi:hypothetical protein
MLLYGIIINDTHSKSIVRWVRISNSRFQISNQQTERTKFVGSV